MYPIRTIIMIISLLVGGFEGFAAERPLPNAPGKTYLVGFAQDTMTNDWRVAQVRELEREFQKYPWITFFYTDGKGQTAQQLLDLEDMIYRKVDVLITSPRDAAVMTPVISKAYQQGIPVILVSRGIENENFTTLIHPDNRKIARQAAAYIARQLNGQGKIFILQHIPTTTVGKDRTEAFFEEIRKYPELEVVGMKVANSLRADAIKMTEEALQEGLHFDALYAQSDSMASGARMVLKKAGINLKDLVIVGIDYIAEARDAIRNGEEDATFTYPTGGKEAAECAVKILQGQSVPKEYVLDAIMVTKENVELVEPIF
jgi:ribose transport system substrate-binding protein